jgi:DNA-binding IclR family transcriptional regulator
MNGRRKTRRESYRIAQVEQAEAKGSIQVIERMMSLIDALADTAEPMSLKALSRLTGLHPSTAHRILAAMTQSRLVDRCEAGTYGLGIRFLELGNVVKSRFSIRDTALPVMQELHEALGEAVNLGIRDKDEIVYLERTSSGRSLVRVVYLIGARAPLHLTSLGKLFLAADSAANVRAYAERTGLPGKTPRSLTSFEQLEKELETIRRDDLAYDNEEAELGLRCIAAPIRNDEGTVVAGLSISAPTERHNPNWTDQLRQATASISQALGYRQRAARS